MSHPVLIHHFVCLATARPTHLLPIREQPDLEARMIWALTAADAIAQAELELRLHPPLRLVGVEPFDADAHVALFLSRNRTASGWSSGAEDLGRIPYKPT